MSIYIDKCEVLENIEVAQNIFFLKVDAPNIARNITPGQFCNILVDNYGSPFLRRPLSVAFKEKNIIGFLFDVVGVGTEILSKRNKGEFLSIEGPLGNGFTFDNSIDVAILLGGGIGIAPLPFLRESLHKKGINTITFWGSKTSEKLSLSLFDEIYFATDDGTEGYKGNVVQSVENLWGSINRKNIKAFACGPTPMLVSAQKFFREKNVPLDISVESRMACGIGICQGCPIKSADSDGYKLVCKDGPVFNSEEIIL